MIRYIYSLSRVYLISDPFACSRLRRSPCLSVVRGCRAKARRESEDVEDLPAITFHGHRKRFRFRTRYCI